MTALNVAAVTTPYCPTAAAPCSTGQSLGFSVNAFGWDFTCATHTFVWNFGDGQSLSGQQVNHAYALSGTYNASVTITRPGATYTAPVTVYVTGGAGGGGNTTCAIPATNSVYIGFGAASGCSSSNGQACKIGETINFNSQSFGGFDRDLRELHLYMGLR